MVLHQPSVVRDVLRTAMGTLSDWLIYLAVVQMIVEGCGLVGGRYIGASQVYVSAASMYVRP